MWRKRLIQYALPALRFKTCRLLSGNVWNRELTIIQHRILKRLRNKKRSIKREIYSRKNLNSYIQSQTTRKLSLFHGDLPITEMHRRRKRSYIPFLLNPETRSDVIPVRLHFRSTIPQARQPISHRRVCVNHRMVNIIHFKVSRGDIISFQEKISRGPVGAQSPLDQFAIVPLIPMKEGKLYFSFTNASFYLLLTLSFVLFVFYLVTKKGGGKSVANACQSVLELIYDFVPNLVNEQIGGLSGNVKQKYFPCISVTFTFSLFRNLQGMIPYSFTVTSHFIVTLGLSFSLFIGITIVGFVQNGLHFLSFSLPAGVPLPLAPFLVLLELIPHCFRALSLGIRLFANMMAGHSLVKILSGFAWTMLCMNDLFYFIGSTGPFFIVLALTGLELGVAILQAYVFTILICIYLNDAINLH